MRFFFDNPNQNAKIRCHGSLGTHCPFFLQPMHFAPQSQAEAKFLSSLPKMGQKGASTFFMQRWEDFFSGGHYELRSTFDETGGQWHTFLTLLYVTRWLGKPTSRTRIKLIIGTKLF